MIAFRYAVTVTDGAGAVHHLEGTIDAPAVHAAPAKAIEASFAQLTGGDTTIGRPGAGACRGPYRIDRLEVARV